MNRFTNSRISSATAHRIGHDGIDQLIGWIRMFSQKRASAHDHSRLAIAALCHVLREPGPLTRMTHIGRETFDRDKTSRRSLRRGNLTGTQGLPVFQNGARPADTDTATEFGPRKPQSIAQDPKQRRVVINIDAARRAVNGKAKFGHWFTSTVDLQRQSRRR